MYTTSIRAIEAGPSILKQKKWSHNADLLTNRNKDLAETWEF